MPLNKETKPNNIVHKWIWNFGKNNSLHNTSHKKKVSFIKKKRIYTEYTSHLLENRVNEKKSEK